MAAEGKKDVTVSVKMKVADVMSGAAKKYDIQDKKLASLIKKEFKFEKKVETDPKKNSQRDLDDAMKRLLDYAMGIIANRLDKLGSGKADDKEKKKVEAEALSDLEEIFKAMPKVCEEKLDDILSGKEDNKGAIKKGTQAFAKLDKVDPKGAFDQPRKDLIKIFQTLETALKGSGDKKAVSAKAAKEIEEVRKAMNDRGMEVANAAEFMLRTATSLKNDRKADSELVAFAKKVLKFEGALGGFDERIDEFNDVLDDALEQLKAGEMEASTARAFGKGLGDFSDLEGDGREIAALVKKLKPEFDKIAKKLS